MKDATHRISDLVAAVREYSQLDRASVQTINVTEGLESTLVMFGYRLRRDIKVERDFDPELPRIEAIPGELNQVWTNLIANALDAMDGTGTLRLTTRVDDLGWVVVEIADTGPGMPEHLQARAFEPFFTTKDVGVGTGLGLDISRRIIVDRHSGEITIDSVPGRTVLRGPAAPAAYGTDPRDRETQVRPRIDAEIDCRSEAAAPPPADAGRSTPARSLCTAWQVAPRAPGSPASGDHPMVAILHRICTGPAHVLTSCAPSVRSDANRSDPRGAGPEDNDLLPPRRLRRCRHRALPDPCDRRTRHHR